LAPEESGMSDDRPLGQPINDMPDEQRFAKYRDVLVEAALQDVVGAIDAAAIRRNPDAFLLFMVMLVTVAHRQGRPSPAPHFEWRAARCLDEDDGVLEIRPRKPPGSPVN